jgi:pyruvate dehydrogenase E1 component alpha subunit
MPVRDAFPTPLISQRAAAYAMPGVTVDGNDLFAVYAASAEAVARARAGGGPSLIEARTYRWRGHSKSDRNLYRTQQEIAEWKARDPIPQLRERLIADGVIDAAGAEAIVAQVQQAIADAVAFAESSPEPDPAALEDEVYA